MKQTKWIIWGIAIFMIMYSECTLKADTNAPVLSEEKVYVDLTVKAEVVKLAPNSEGVVLISLIPRSGVKLNKIPPLHVKIESTEILRFEKSELLLPSAKELKKLEDKYFETMMDPDADMTQFYFPNLKPLRFPFTILKQPPANFRVNIKLAYTYCTVKDGFCAPREKTLEVPLTVKKEVDEPEDS